MLNKILSQDTIVAPITPIGGSVCVIRISGSGSLRVLRSVFDSKVRDFESHRVYYGWIVDKVKEQVIDEVLVTVMLAPKSFTMEDVVEIGCHGGVKSAEAVLALIEFWSV